MAIEIEIKIEQPSVELSAIAVSDTHGEDSPYFAGWKAYDDNPYDNKANPSGVIQMGLAENQASKIKLKRNLEIHVSFDLLEEYLDQHSDETNWSKTKSVSFRESALFQDYHGLTFFRKAMASFKEQIRCGKAKFDFNRVVLNKRQKSKVRLQ